MCVSQSRRTWGSEALFLPGLDWNSAPKTSFMTCQGGRLVFSHTASLSVHIYLLLLLLMGRLKRFGVLFKIQGRHPHHVQEAPAPTICEPPHRVELWGSGQ